MLLLAVDSSDKNGSIALAKCGPGEACDVLEVILLAGGTFSAQLVPQIAALLNKHEFSKEDIGAFAVVSGPGSFTGLRIGLAAVKALGEILEKPIAAVSLLEAVAIAGKTRGRVMAALDAGRNEVYAGEYEVESGVERIDERLVTQPELIKIAAGGTRGDSGQEIGRHRARGGFGRGRGRAARERCHCTHRLEKDSFRRNRFSGNVGCQLHPPHGWGNHGKE